MGSSKDLSKHIKVVVSSCQSNSQSFMWKHWVTPSSSLCLSLCLCFQCDGTDLTSKVQDLKLQCLVFLNIPRLINDTAAVPLLSSTVDTHLYTALTVLCSLAEFCLLWCLSVSISSGIYWFLNPAHKQIFRNFTGTHYDLTWNLRVT